MIIRLGSGRGLLSPVDQGAPQIRQGVVSSVVSKYCGALLILLVAVSPADAKKRRYDPHTDLSRLASPELIAKTKEIVRECGSKVVSARSPRSNHSNHPIGRAVDLQGNPQCIYRMLSDWPGGYSTDYNSAPNCRHVHISYNPGGQEWGSRFRHPRRYPATMMARHAPSGTYLIGKDHSTP